MNVESETWRVLLIGGSSGVGKTVTAQACARRLGAACLLADDIRIALLTATTPAQQPALHVFQTYTAEHWLDPPGIQRDWIRLAQAMLAPLSAIVAHHLMVQAAGRLIIEGDALLPQLAAPSAYAGVTGLTAEALARQVRCVFLVEPDEERLLANLRARGQGFQSQNLDTQRAFARASRLYGQWLANEAAALGLAVLSAGEGANLVDQILEAL